MSACNVWDNDGLCKKTAALFYEFVSMSKKATRRETLTRQEEAELQMFEAKVSRLDSEKAEVMKSFAQSALSPRFVFALLQVLIKREGKSETRGVELPNVDRDGLIGRVVQTRRILRQEGTHLGSEVLLNCQRRWTCLQRTESRNQSC